MPVCNEYDPHEIFEKFEVIEFPTSFVGLSTTKILHINIDLENSAYIKTLHQGKLMKFTDAREISPSHRAFNLKYLNDNNIEITFSPTNECISKAKVENNYENVFVIDLRLIKVDGYRCCYNELHSEVARYYVSGEFEYCKISNLPEVISFGDIVINEENKKNLQIQNDSNSLLAKIRYVKIPGFEITPSTISVPSNSTKNVIIKVRPMSFNIKNSVCFKVINPHDCFDNEDNQGISDNNNEFIVYSVKVKMNIKYQETTKKCHIESLHKLNELNPVYTYVNNELTEITKRKIQALTYLREVKPLKPKTSVLNVRNRPNDLILKSILSYETPKTVYCANVTKTISVFDLLNIQLYPFCLNYGKIAYQTHGEGMLTIRNNTESAIRVQFNKDTYITYSIEKKPTLCIKLNAFSETQITINCFGHTIGFSLSSFDYIIEERYNRKHLYSLDVSDPILTIVDKYLKFGMVTPETFTVSTPLRICNNFNIPIKFQWEEINSDVPFDFIPTNGTIEPQSCKVIDIIYVSKVTKVKVHEINLMSIHKCITMIPVELTVVTRKLSIKFLQPAVIFGDIPLNLVTVENVKMENSSREIALFHVVEQLIPGITVNPMNGIIRPKMIVTFEIIVKIPSPLEFAFDVYVKINNRENVVLPISGNVIEPKIIINPKNINMSRIPCNMITYVPIMIHNISSSKTLIEISNSDDDNLFEVFAHYGNVTQKLDEIVIEGGQTKTVSIKVYDTFRREYDMYIPFKINNLLGPPNLNTPSTELQHYIGDFEKVYENNPKVKIKYINKEISFCRISGVITVPWIQFSRENFEINFDSTEIEKNIIDFTMTNTSKYILYVSILTTKLAPNFTLCAHNLENPMNAGENLIKFELEEKGVVEFTLRFHPRGHGRFTSVGLLYLDKNMNIPYYNLNFVGIKETPKLIPSTHRIIFPPNTVQEEDSRTILLTLDCESDLAAFSYSTKDNLICTVSFVNLNIVQEKSSLSSIITVQITVFNKTADSNNAVIRFYHDCGAVCEIDIYYCFTYCPITLHAKCFTDVFDYSYPYYPESSQHDFYEYMECCTNFLERWMFQQGFHKDLYPIIPDTFHAISNTMSSQPGKSKSKGINISYLNFIRRISGPLMKHIRKISIQNVEDSVKWVKEIHDTYQEIVNVLKSRGVHLWTLHAKFLLSYEQFLIYTDNVTTKSNADLIITQELRADISLYYRLNKQSWIDFILQTYKVFIMDSCFFDCICITSQPRDIIKILLQWYNENLLKCNSCNFQKPKIISNITKDLSDGFAVISTILNYCPFMGEHFSLACDIDNSYTQLCITNNACLIIEALNLLKIYFPLSSNDFIQPNFLQMLFLSIHLYISLPMFVPKEEIYFNPPLLKSSTRTISLSLTSQESLSFNFFLINNMKNSFTVEKAPTDSGKKLSISVKYVANFVETEKVILLIHGNNKTRIFDTFVVFLLNGRIGSLSPLRKCKVTGLLHRPQKVDVLIASPFLSTNNYFLQITDDEPSIPIKFEENTKPRFYIQRLNLIEKSIVLTGIPKDSGQEVQDQKLYLQLICLSTMISNSWIWFRSGIGEFYIKITIQPRWDIPIDNLYFKIEPCSCEEECECFGMASVLIPQHNEIVLKSVRMALSEHASEIMMQVFDKLRDTTSGKMVLLMLLEEGETNCVELRNIFRSKIRYKISSRNILLEQTHITLDQNSCDPLELPVTLSAHDNTEKYYITLTSDYEMDIRTYKIMFMENDSE